MTVDCRVAKIGVTIILDGDNGLQPDVQLRIVSEAGRQSTLNDKNYVVDAPEFTE